jgi:hypothetical protein
MNILFWGLTLGLLGKLLLAIGVLKVHVVMARERAIGEQVIHTFQFEKVLTLVAVICIVVGYVMEIYFYKGTELITCRGADCVASAATTIAPR